jgi:hypothetical protein
MVEEVLPDVPYLQLVFTIPKMLRRAFLFDRSLYGELARAAYASFAEFFAARFPALDRPVPAVIVAPQSFGSLLNVHPHAHAISSLGVFDRQGNFHPAPQDLDFSPLETIFREHVFRFLLKKERITPERIELLRSWTHSGFNIDSSRRVAAGDRQELENLLQYIERAPVSLERLTYHSQEDRIHYQGKFHPALGTDHLLLGGLEFLARLVPHISLRYEVTIRTYGALSTTIRGSFGWLENKTKHPSPPAVITLDGSDQSRLHGEKEEESPAVITLDGSDRSQLHGEEEEETEFVRVRKRNWARLIRKVWLQDPELCPRCGSRMSIIAALTSPHHDEAIERILRCRGEWAPPWQKERPPRGPPRELDLFDSTEPVPETEELTEPFPDIPDDAQLPSTDPEDENQDPPGDWWLE